MTLEVQDDKGLSIYWDYGTAQLKAVSGYEVVRKIRSAVHIFGPIQSFKAYYDSSNESLSTLRSELGSSGVSLIDCPSNGRKEAPTKIMIVDIIAHTFDHSAPRTVAIISGDRDLAYLIATLRMRKYQVVLISPHGTHPSLIKQASVHLDWTTGIADMDDSPGGHPPSPHLPPSPHRPPSLPSPPSPSFPPPPPPPATRGLFSYHSKSDFLSKAQEEIEPPAVELRGMSTRGRQKPIFTRPDRFNIFGDLEGSFPSPRVSSGMFGLGDGPLFPRSHPRVPPRQVRSDSAPPGFVHTHPPSSPPESNGGQVTSSGKGKQREFPITEPEDIASQSPLTVKMSEELHSASVSGTAGGFFHSSSEKVNVPLTSGTSTHSSRTSRDSTFSVIRFPPSSDPTSAEAAYINNDDVTDRAKSPATIIVIAPQGPISASPVRETEKVSSLENPSAEKEETGEAIPTKEAPRLALPIQPQAPPLPPSSRKKVPQPKATSTINAQAGPTSSSTPAPMNVPPQFRPLVDTLRQHQRPYRYIALPAALLARDRDVYKKANVHKYTSYIAAAVEAGLVQEVNATNELCISLTAQYA